MVDRAPGAVEIEVPIGAVGLAPQLKKLLDITALHDVGVPLEAGHEGDRAW